MGPSRQQATLRTLRNAPGGPYRFTAASESDEPRPGRALTCSTRSRTSRNGLERRLKTAGDIVNLVLVLGDIHGEPA